MSEPSTTAPAGEPNEQTTGETGKEFEAITSQEDFDARIQARIARERSKFENYDELKAKAEQLSKIEEANKTEAERNTEQLTALQARNAELEVQAIRATVAASKGVPAELLTGGTQEELEAAADALIQFRADQKVAPSSSALGRVNQAAVKGTTADQFASFVEGQFN